MALTTFSGPVKSNNGFITGGAGSSVVLIADTALTVADHAGRNLLGFNATATITLPPIEDVGTRATNMLGTQFTIIVLLAATNLTINTDGVDKYVGAINVSAANSTAGKAFFPDGANDIITLNGTTQGGAVGTMLRFTAIANNLYFVEGMSHSASGTIATPFSGS
tara:strand:- start:1498 stop:1992 length:495 start_codon:yes stop_codon:yes gene_type:complete